MLKRSMAAGLFACAAIAPMALAQGTQPQQNQMNQPVQGKVQFIRTLEANSFRGTDLMGQTVYNRQDENIGDIGDVLLDRGGRVHGVVIDVGGFLGLGESEIAVPMNALSFEPLIDQEVAGADDSIPPARETGRSAAAGKPGAAGAPPAAGQSGYGTKSTSGRVQGDTANTTGNPGSANRAAGMTEEDSPADRTDAANEQMARTDEGAMTDSTFKWKLVLNTNREDLQGAPKFEQDNAGAEE